MPRSASALPTTCAGTTVTAGLPKWLKQGSLANSNTSVCRTWPVPDDSTGAQALMLRWWSLAELAPTASIKFAGLRARTMAKWLR